MLSVKSLTFAWWNTGLAPSAASRSTLKDRATACRVVIELITQIGADFIALGEMSEFDLDEMATLLAEFDFDVKSGITKAAPGVRIVVASPDLPETRPRGRKESRCAVLFL